MTEDDDTAEPARAAWATWLLVAVNVGVSLEMLLQGASAWSASVGDVVAAGGVHPVRVWQGEVWRLVSACFVHVAWWHLALNMYVLVQLGRVLERVVGGSRLLLVYLASGVFGFALSLGLRGNPTAGASGSIFGVTGALLAIALLARGRGLGKALLRSLLPFVGATFLFGLLVDRVDNLAHLGGLAMGFALGLGLLIDDARAGLPAPRAARASAAILVSMGLVFLGALVYAARPVWSPRYHAGMGLSALQGQRVEEAAGHLTRASEVAPGDAFSLILAGRVGEERAGTEADRQEARRLLREGLARLDADNPSEAMQIAQLALSLDGATGDLPFEDVRTMNALCDAALELPFADEDGQQEAEVALLRNDCAWIKLKAVDPRVRDPRRALGLARAALAATPPPPHPAIVHTWAEALAQNGQAGEGAAVLERLLASGQARQLPGGEPWLHSEIARLRRLAAQGDVPAASR